MHTLDSLKHQVGGSHYKNMAIQPVEFIVANNLGFIEGNIIKYTCRWREANGVEDLKKIEQYVQILIEHCKNEKKQPRQTRQTEIDDPKHQAYLNQAGCEGGSCDS